MCNAWNHSPDCTCGWGGVGHLGRRSGDVRATQALWPAGIPPINGSISSITIPNAQCPVCGEPVFYYCNEYGSSVFFDELGPPWPKHPCTNHYATTQPLAASSGLVKSYSHAPQWSREGWHLATVSHVASIDRLVRKVGVRDDVTGIDHTLYAVSQQAMGHKDISDVLGRNALAFILGVRAGVFVISSLERTLTPVRWDALSSLIALHEQMHPVGRSPRRKRRPKRAKATTPKNKSSSSVRKETAMSAAFSEAEQHNGSPKRTR